MNTIDFAESRHQKARDNPLLPEFTSITDIPSTMGDQRSTTPYLGDNDNEQEKKKDMASTH